MVDIDSNDPLVEVLEEAGLNAKRLEAGVIMRLSNAVLEGNISAGLALRELLDRRHDEEALAAHRQALADFASDGPALAGYLGEHGETKAGAEMVLGHEMGEDEEEAFERGRQGRQLEVKVVQLRRFRAAGGPVESWMR